MLNTELKLELVL